MKAVITSEVTNSRTGQPMTYVKVGGKYEYRVEAHEDRNPTITSYTNHGIVYHTSQKGYAETVAAVVEGAKTISPDYWLGDLIW